MYLRWDEPQSDEPPGWYSAVISEYHSDGDATIEYTNKTSKSEWSRMEAHKERANAISPSLQNLCSFSTQEDSSNVKNLNTVYLLPTFYLLLNLRSYTPTG